MTISLIAGRQAVSPAPDVVTERRYGLCITLHVSSGASFLRKQPFCRFNRQIEFWGFTSDCITIRASVSLAVCSHSEYEERVNSHRSSHVKVLTVIVVAAAFTVLLRPED